MAFFLSGFIIDSLHNRRLRKRGSKMVVERPVYEKMKEQSKMTETLNMSFKAVSRLAERF